MRLIKTAFLIALIWILSAPVIPFIAHEIMPAYANAAAYAEQAAQGQPLSAQAASAEKEKPGSTSAVLYQVMGVVLIAWIGLALFLFRLDRRVTALEKETRKRG